MHAVVRVGNHDVKIERLRVKRRFEYAPGHTVEKTVRLHGKWLPCLLYESEGKFCLVALSVYNEKKHVREDIELENLAVSRLKRSLLLFLMGDHAANHKLRIAHKWLHDNRRKLWIFSIATVATALYHYSDALFGCKCREFIDHNSYFQSITMFLTFAGFISIFFPSGSQKALTSSDVRKFSNRQLKAEARGEEPKVRIPGKS